MIYTKRIFTGLVLFLGACCVYGQPGGQTGTVQREVYAKTSTAKTFKIPCDVEFAELSPLDFVYLEAKPALMQMTEFVIDDFRLSITRINPHLPRYERDYEFQMGKSVTNAWGTTLYTHDGEEYYSLPNDEENELFTINPDEIQTYGFFNNMFDVSIGEIQAFCDSASIPLYIWGQKVLVVYEEEDDAGEIKRTETEMDLENLCMEMRLFKNGTHVLTDRAEYVRTADDWVIPSKKKHVYYSELPSGTLYQITQVEMYLSYKVVAEDGNILVNMEKPFSIQVSPDPAQDSIWVHFSVPIDGNIAVRIADIENTTVWEKDTTLWSEKLFIDISPLKSGLYTVFCTYNNIDVSADFLKDGIGQYTNTNPVNIAIQVLPNPALNLIKVVFPMAIDADMQVKITNVMGVAYFDSQVHISGNEFPINISSFPLGMYYIVCTNGDGIAYTKFFKQ